jgi:hypothetical protein
MRVNDHDIYHGSSRRCKSSVRDNPVEAGRARLVRGLGFYVRDARGRADPTKSEQGKCGAPSHWIRSSLMLLIELRKGGRVIKNTFPRP